MSWVAEPAVGDARVQCSAHGATHPAHLSLDDDRIHVEWAEPQRRVAPGQSVVFYDDADRRVLGGGICT